MSNSGLPTDPTPQGADQTLPVTTLPDDANKTPGDDEKFRVWFNELPILGSLWLLSLVVLALGVVQVQLYKHQQFLIGVVTLLVLLLVLHVGGRVNLYWNVRYRPLRSSLFVLAYFVAGVLWIFGFWTFEMNKKANEAFSAKTEWRKERGYTADQELPEAVQAEWKKYYDANPQIFQPPTYKDRKAELAWRGLLWPVSMPYELLSEWLSKLWETIVDAIGGALDAIQPAVLPERAWLMCISRVK